MRQSLTLLFMFIVFLIGLSAVAKQAKEANAFSKSSATPVKDSLHLSNLESNEKLWALLQYESTYGRIEFKSLRAFGDYAGSNLRDVKAVGFKLSGFNFSNADLRGADFRSANLKGANFVGADLREAVLISAETEGCYFSALTKLPFSKDEAKSRGWREVTR